MLIFSKINSLLNLRLVGTQSNSGGFQQDNIILPRMGKPRNEDSRNIDFEPRRRKRARTAKEFGPDFYSFTVEGDPSSLKEAITSSDSDIWQGAINDEMDSLESNKT